MKFPHISAIEQSEQFRAIKELSTNIIKRTVQLYFATAGLCWRMTLGGE